MVQLLLPIIYISFISLGLPDSLLGSAWPSMYPALGVPVSYAGLISMIISFGTIVSSPAKKARAHLVNRLQECYNKGRKPRRKGDKNHGIP